MRIVSVTWAHNEEDVIETFVRHHAAMVDEMIIVLHECTDATEQILQRLQAEGLPITIRYDHRPFYERTQSLAECIQDISVNTTAQWVLPLDADELLCSSSTRHPREELEGSNANTLYELPWKTYVPIQEGGGQQTDIRTRIEHRRTTEPTQFCKVLVPTAITRNTFCMLGKGCHSLQHEGSILPTTRHPALYLAHFPVRSESQIRAKVKRICTMRTQDPTRMPEESFHLFALQARCTDPTPFSPEELTKMATGYASKTHDVNPELTYDPVPILQQYVGLPTVEIHGPFFKNSGDHLMAYAITKNLEEHATVCMKSDRGNLWSPRVRVTSDYLRWYPNPMAGETVDDHDISAVIDCSGYAYSSVWGDSHIVNMAEQYRHWKNCGRSIVMFPQSFGPFYSQVASDAIRTMVSLADAVYVREAQSQRYLLSVCHTAKNICLAPDFTASVAGEAPEIPPTPHTIAIIPNKRMMDKTDDTDGTRYRAFLQRCIALLRTMNLPPVLVEHEQGDRDLIQELANAYAVPTYSNLDPVALKGFLGACHGIISSRYHGCIAGLSLGIPVLATSWNHKYEDLFGYYGCRENILSVDMHDFQLERSFAVFASPDLHKKYAHHIEQAAQRHRNDISVLWANVLPTLLTPKKHCSSPSLQYNQVV